MTDSHDSQASVKNGPALEGEVLTQDQVAALSGHTSETIREYRSRRNRHRGPPFHRDGKTVYYVKADVLQWIEARLSSRRGMLR